MTAKKKSKKSLPDAEKMENIIEGASTFVEHKALVAISQGLARLFEDPAFEAELLAAAGKKASQRYLDDIAEDIKERVLKDIARIYNEGLY